MEKKYEDNHKLIENSNKIIGKKKNNDIKQKENNDLKEKHQFIDEPKSKMDEKKIPSKNSGDDKKGQLWKSRKEKEEEINLSENQKIEMANKIILDYELGNEYSVEKVIKKIEELNTKDILDEEDLMNTVGYKLSK